MCLSQCARVEYPKTVVNQPTKDRMAKISTLMTIKQIHPLCLHAFTGTLYRLMVGWRINVYEAEGAPSGINKLPNIDFKTLLKMMNVLSKDGLSDCAETFIHATDNFFFLFH